MEALILVGLVVFVTLVTGLLMYRLRGGSVGRPPLWLLIALLGLMLLLLLVSALLRSWLTVATFALLAISYVAMLVDALRRRRSA
jgi:uncharacterized membrane protein YoaK (UPF0700 family)